MLNIQNFSIKKKLETLFTTKWKRSINFWLCSRKFIFRSVSGTIYRSLSKSVLSIYPNCQVCSRKITIWIIPKNFLEHEFLLIIPVQIKKLRSLAFIRNRFYERDESWTLIIAAISDSLNHSEIDRCKRREFSLRSIVWQQRIACHKLRGDNSRKVGYAPVRRIFMSFGTADCISEFVNHKVLDGESKTHSS